VTGSRPANTFPKLLHRHAAERPRDIALLEKRYGIWHQVRWEEYAQRVRDFAHGLAELGVRRGDVVAVLADNGPPWLIAELAAQCLGAAVVGVYPTSVGDEVVCVLGLAGVRVVVAADQEQVDKLIGLAGRLPALETIVYIDPRGLSGYEQPYLRRFVDVEAAGRRYGEHRAGWLNQQIELGRPDDVAVICTTSGTTARPKLAQLSHDNLLSVAGQLALVDPLRRGDRYVSFLPLAWIGEQMLAVACGLSAALALYFPEGPATARSDLREVGPQVMFNPPRVWASMLSDVQGRVDDAGWLKRVVFGWAYNVGDRVAERRTSGRRVAGPLRAIHRVADAVGLRPVRDRLGLTRLRLGYTTGAALPPEVFRFYQAIGVNLKQVYGQTETCGIAVLHRDDDVRHATVGIPLPGTALRLADDGEILLRPSSVFRGYLHDHAGTRRAVDSDGWLHTGDVGYLYDGHLVLIDRRADVLRLAGGRFSAAIVENTLTSSRYFEEAVSFPGAAGVTAIVSIDPATVGAWAQRERLAFTTYADLAAKPEVAALAADEVRTANQDLPEPVRVRRFVLLHKQLDPDDGEITRTGNVRRAAIAARYTAIVEALDRGADLVEVNGTVTDRDGTRIGHLTPLRILEPATVRADTPRAVTLRSRRRSNRSRRA
jgi:long-chain acyl-CoA synthetase